MAKLTTEYTLNTVTWTQIATSTQKFLAEVATSNGQAHIAYSSAAPTVSAGHALDPGDTFGDDSNDENVWAIAKTGSALLIVTTQ